MPHTTVHTLAPLAALSRSIDSILDAAPQPDVSAIKAAVLDAFRLGNWIPGELTTASDQGYARHVLHSDPVRRYAILALVWQEGQASPVHAHHAWCAYGVVAGELFEDRFEYVPDAQGASATGGVPRRQGDGGCGQAGLAQVHRLRNTRRDTAISVHVYGVPATELATGLNHILPLVTAAIA